MNLKDCYTAFGGDYEEVMSRLRLEKTVTKFLLKYSEDKSFFMFKEADLYLSIFQKNLLKTLEIPKKRSRLIGD